MRISLRPKDSGYHNYIHTRSRLQRTIIKLDGVVQSACITADDEAGVIVRYKEPMAWDAERACLIDEVVHGRVEIDICDEEVL